MSVLLRRYLLLVGVVFLVAMPFRASSARDHTIAQLASTERLDTLPMRHAVHQINKLALCVTNRGLFGRTLLSMNNPYDFITGEIILTTAEFPAGSRRDYLGLLGLWIGTVKRGIPIVSNSDEYLTSFGGGEMLPNDPPGSIGRRSNLRGSSIYDPSAVSEEDFIADYTDTLAYSSSMIDARPNPKSLSIAVHQESYGWSAGYLEDIIIVRLNFRNFGSTFHDSVYIGLHVVPDGKYIFDYRSDDPVGIVNGYYQAGPASSWCGIPDTLNLFFGGDVSGKPYEGEFIEEPISVPGLQGRIASARGVLGLRVLQAPQTGAGVAYNWWGIGHLPEPEYGLCTGGPSKTGPEPAASVGYKLLTRTDKQKYDLLSNGEFDHGSVWTGMVARSHLTEWKPMSIPVADCLTTGLLGEYLISWGPFRMSPGGVIPITFALIGGENFHADPNNFARLPLDPQGYLDNVDFSDVTRNALMAGWVYDNPGVDTDGDGYFGEFRVCVHDSALIDGSWVASRADTQWYRGDGIPDFCGALPPPSPDVWVTPVHNGLRVRFNGERSETEKDLFLQIPDWEGYRIYIGRDERETSLSLVGSYDQLDFDKYYYNLALDDGPEWQLLDRPFTLDSLRCLYGAGPEPCNDTTFDPVLFTQSHWYRHPDYPDSIFMFKDHDYNTADLGINTPVTKVYPDMPDPRFLPADSITEDMYTEYGCLKFFEYEMTIENILPTVPYYVSVTAIDFGSPAQGIYPMESSKFDNMTPAFPLHELDAPLSGNGDVYVYPNPYRIDAGYRGLGYEGRNQDHMWHERVRSIWFANLPPRCTIRIFSLDGDRIKTIEHDMPISDPTYSRHRWDLINRNFQMIVSGLYYWTVDAPDQATQIGKLVILR